MGVDNPIKWVLITMPNIPLRMGIDQHPAPMMIGGTWDKEQHQENRVSRSMSIGEVEHMEHGSWRRCSCNNKAEEHEHDHKLLLEDEDERRIESRDKGRDRGCSSRMSMVMRISRIMMSRRRKREQPSQRRSDLLTNRINLFINYIYILSQRWRMAIDTRSTADIALTRTALLSPRRVA